MNRYDNIEEVKKDRKSFGVVEKFNPYHGWHGRFASANGATTGAGSSGYGSSSDTALSGGRAGGGDRSHRISAAQDRISTALKKGASVDLSAAVPEMAERVAGVVEKMMDRYPDMKDSIDAFTCVDEKYWALNSGLVAAFDAQTNTIRLNPAMFGDKASAEETWKGMVERKHHPEGVPVEGAVAHEMGHAFDHYISKQLFDGGLDIVRTKQGTREKDSISKRLCAEEAVKRERQGKPMTSESVKNELSGYATTSPAEMFAEAFSEYTMSPDPRPMAQSFGEGFERYREQLNGGR